MGDHHFNAGAAADPRTSLLVARPRSPSRHPSAQLAGTIFVGIMLFGEILTPAKLAGLSLSFAGVVVLAFVEEAEESLPASWNVPLWSYEGRRMKQQ